MWHKRSDPLVLQFLFDSLRMQFLEPQEFTTTKMDQWICDLAMAKKNCKDYFLNTWIHTNTEMSADEKAVCTRAFADHASARQMFLNYPDQPVNDFSQLYWDNGQRPKSFRLIVEFWSQLIFGEEYDSSLKQAAKYLPENYLHAQLHF